MDDIDRSKLASWLKRNLTSPRVAIYVDAAEQRIMELKEVGPAPGEEIVRRPVVRKRTPEEQRVYMREYMRKYRKAGKGKRKRKEKVRRGADGVMGEPR